MTSRNGADVPAAIRYWREAGYSIRQLADNLDVHPSTAYRWANGSRFPNGANFIALREEIGMRYAAENARHNLTVVGAQLASAYEALETNAERSRADALAAELGARFAERDREQEQAEEDAYQARQARRIARQRTSITAQADPFAVVATGRPREVAMFS